MNSADKDSWLEGGDCKVCRRNSYCKKPCTANSRRSAYISKRIMDEAMSKIFPAGPILGHPEKGRDY